MATSGQPPTDPPPWSRRLAGAPISWGACEVPGWGPMPAPDDVLAEMAAVGLSATELGAPGFLPVDPAAARATGERHGLHILGGFCPLVLHREPTDRQAVQAAVAGMAALGAEVLVLALVEDEHWSAPQPLDDADWRRLDARTRELDALASEHGLTVALHPHVGTIVETAAQVERALAELGVGWCLDTGHLFIGGFDPVAFAREHGDRVVHVHLKDVDAELAAAVRAGHLSLLEATRQGLFLPLGRGEARIDAVLEALEAHGYAGWFVLEQDTAITGEEPTVPGGPMRDARESIAFLRNSARRTQEVR